MNTSAEMKIEVMVTMVAKLARRWKIKNENWALFQCFLKLCFTLLLQRDHVPVRAVAVDDHAVVVAKVALQM